MRNPEIKLIPIVPDKLFGDAPKVMAVLQSAIRDQVAEGVRYMSEYPPEPSRSTYRRTGTLRRSWSFSISSGNHRIEGKVLSNSGIAPYNKDVQGVEQDYVFTRIGWRNVPELVEKIDDEFPDKVQRLIDKTFGGG